MKDVTKYVDLALRVTAEAERYLLSQRGATSTRLVHKLGTHYGIEEDLVCNRIYETFLRKHSPEVSIYSEEGNKVLTTKLTWIIDPIEGTSNFRVGNPLFATQICLLIDKEAVLAVLKLPVLKETFFSVKGKGATLNGKKIRVSEVHDVKMAMVSIGKGTREQDLQWWARTAASVMRHVRSIRLLGSTGIELSFVACGRLDLHLNNGSQPYDYAPGALLVREAGGDVQSFSKKSWDYNDESIIAGNKKLTNKLQKIFPERYIEDLALIRA